MIRGQKYVLIAKKDEFEEPIGYFLNDRYYEYATDCWVGERVGDRFIYNGQEIETAPPEPV